MIDTVDEDGNTIFWGCRNGSFLRASLDMQRCLLLVGEDTSGLADVVCTNRAPTDFGWVGLVEDFDEVSINLDASVCLLDIALEAA